jgi:hypothetical protein
MGRSGFTLGRQVFFHCDLVKLIGLTLFNGDSALGTLAQAGAQAVTQILRRQYRFSVDHGDGTLGAGRYALATAVAFILINFYNLS